MKKVLIIEDDRVISDGLKLALELENYDVVTAYDGEEGLYYAKSEQPDIIVLDIMMPYMNGFEVTTELRRLGENLPIIILSARDEVKDKIRGLDLGADDYVTKPFDIDELTARVRSLLRRKVRTDISFGKYIYSWQERILMESQTKRVITLSSREQRLLEYFLKRPGRIITRDQIIDSVWGSDYEGTDRTVDNFVLNLRKKIGSNHLVTVRGQGYRFLLKAETSE